MTISNEQLIEGLEAGCKKSVRAESVEERGEIASCAKIILDELRHRGDEKRLERIIREGIDAISAPLQALGKPELESELSRFRESLPDNISWEFYEGNIELLLSIAERVCVNTRAAMAGKPGLFGFIKPILEWEIDVHTYRSSDEQTTDDARPAITREGVTEFIRSQGPEYRDAEIARFRPLPGGFSKETIIVQIETKAHGAEELVLRGEGAVKLLNIKGQDVGKEFWLLKYIFDGSDVKVAEPLWLNDGIAPRYFISRRMPGELKGSHVGPGDPLPDRLVESLALELSKIHNTKLNFADPALAKSHVSLVSPFTRKEAATAALREWTDYWAERICRKSPLVRTAIDWVYDNIPESDAPPVLVHADCGLNNLLIENDEISAVLDWEISHLGDPNEDISWALFGMAQESNRRRFVEKYEEVSGNKIDAFSLKFYEVVAALKILHSLYEAQERYKDADIPEIKLCKLGLPFLSASLQKLLNDIAEADDIKSSQEPVAL